jgi:hypothetical protein
MRTPVRLGQAAVLKLLGVHWFLVFSGFDYYYFEYYFDTTTTYDSGNIRYRFEEFFAAVDIESLSTAACPRRTGGGMRCSEVPPPLR